MSLQVKTERDLIHLLALALEAQHRPSMAKGRQKAMGIALHEYQHYCWSKQDFGSDMQEQLLSLLPPA